MERFFILNRRKFLFIFFLVFFALIFLAAILFFLFHSSFFLSSGPVLRTEKVRSTFDGLLKEKEVLEMPISAVMIDNHPDGRRFHRGFGAASLFYETLAEGGITRIMALFEGNSEAAIGPVRSARSYFVNLAAEYGAYYIHIGGSPDAIQALQRQENEGVVDFDGMRYEGEIPAFFRDWNIAPPHNLFVRLDGILTETLPEKRNPKFRFASTHERSECSRASAGLTRPDTCQDTAVFPAHTIDLDFSFPSYRVRYEYDAALKSYRRFLGGKEHIDSATKAQLFASNVIVQFVKYWPVDEEGRLEFTLRGEGKMWYFRDGQWFKGNWKKSTDDDQTNFLDERGETILLRPGTTWIELIDSGEKVKVSN